MLMALGTQRYVSPTAPAAGARWVILRANRRGRPIVKEAFVTRDLHGRDSVTKRGDTRSLFERASATWSEEVCDLADHGGGWSRRLRWAGRLRY